MHPGAIFTKSFAERFAYKSTCTKNQAVLTLEEARSSDEGARIEDIAGCPD